MELSFLVLYMYKVSSKHDVIVDPVPKPNNSASVVTASVERPHATDNMLQKQASFRGFNKLSQSLPFKRQASLRLGELPSTLERQQAMWDNSGFQQQQQANGRGMQSMSVSEKCKRLLFC